jgi:hypothetical protein
MSMVHQLNLKMALALTFIASIIQPVFVLINLAKAVMAVILVKQAIKVVRVVIPTVISALLAKLVDKDRDNSVLFFKLAPDHVTYANQVMTGPLEFVGIVNKVVRYLVKIHVNLVVRQLVTLPVKIAKHVLSVKCSRYVLRMSARAVRPANHATVA